MTVYHTYTFYTYIKIALINLIRFTANAQLVLKKCISMAMNYIRGEAPIWGILQNQDQIASVVDNTYRSPRPQINPLRA